MYLNKFDFLNNAVGIKTAAHTYFGCEPKELKVEQAATLVGMCKNPSLYNPVRFNERSRGRRNVVLEQMRKAGYITEAECDSLKALPLKLTYNRVDHKEGMATYFREYLRGVMTAPKPVKSTYRGWQMQKYYEDSLAWETNPLYGWCAKNKKKDGTNYNVYTDGLKIYTTLNSHMQQYAEEAVEEHLSFLQPLFFKEKVGSKNAPYARSISAKLVEELKDEFDYIILDCPAGIEQGFKNAIAAADRALIVTTPEVSAIRDADRIIGLLEANDIHKIDLVINRIRMDMVERGDMLSKDDVLDILAVDLIGIVPDDENIVISTNQGEPLVGSNTPAGKAYKNICDRVMGKEVPFMEITGPTFFQRLAHVFKK